MAGLRYAWCQELDETVQAREAKREYLGAEPRPPRFHFFCQYEDCRTGPDGTRTRVTCVNYQAAPDQKQQSVVVHYRELDDHEADCPDFDPMNAGKRGAARSRGRKVGVKVADAIDVFDPADEAPSSGLKRPGTEPSVQLTSTGRPSSGTSALSKDARPQGVSSTRFIEDIALIHFEAVRSKGDPEAAAVLARPISVPGRGQISFASLFCHVKFARLDGTEAVWYGGAKFKPYGKGFKLTFMDRLGGEVLTTYIASDVVQQYRYRKQLEELIEQAKQCTYVTAYIWGQVERGEAEGNPQLQPSKLQHLALIMGPQKPPEAEDNSRPRNSNK